ncbi:MAG TPA: BTAD domain-containing putative transcriptional regulator [Gaiellaceae bacterium]|nr:BTAD domain-containing putative transcriptional regulator [Gaiellaceae bacterium]
MEFQILGGLEAHDGDREVALGSALQRALLATLLLNVGRPVSVDELIEALWPEHPPASAVHAIEVYVSRLRKVLGPARLQRSGHGYVLHLERSDEVDALQFERLVERGTAELSAERHDLAGDVLREALALWRGEPLGGLDCGPLVRAAAGRLEHLRLTALEARIDADLASGRESGLVAELEELVAAEPLRERFRRQLMLALYRDGRQADALRAYQDARTMLRDELGLEPSRSLQQLERDILNHAPELDRRPTPARWIALPAPVTPLVGRAAELDDLDSLLRSDTVRLLTVTGAGGVGKTRLALEAARSVEHDWGDGVVFVELAGTHRPGLVVHTIAAALGVREQTGMPLLETVAGALSDRKTLLLLDNFEHLLDAAPVISDLLAAAGGVKVLATSRTRLRLYGEHEYSVPPLPTPAAGERSVDALLRVEAVEFFVSCTRRRVAGFKLDHENAGDVAEICIRLDGMPLAIELAAARGDAFDPAALLAQLDARLPVLVGGPCDSPERHRSLRATIDWSYDLLDLQERRLFAKLGVFTGGFTPEACAEICSARESKFESLVEKNLVLREGGRYTTLETLREYALERLRDTGGLEAMQLRHAEFFVGLAERAEAELRGPAQLTWLTRLDVEQANIWSAFGRALDAGRADLSLRIGAALWRYWEARGVITEARRRLDDALGATAEGGFPSRAPALFASGRMALRQGDLDHAREVFTEGHALFRADERWDGVALCTAGLGWIMHVVGPFDEAVALCRNAVELARGHADEWVLGDALNNLGVALRTAHDLTGSRVALEESLAIRRRIGDLEGVTAALNGLALNALAEDDFDGAESLFGEAFAVSESRGDLFYAAAKSIVFAYVAFGRGDLSRATVLSVRALEACRERGYQQFAAYALETLAGVAAAEGRPRQAARLLGAAVSISERIGRGHGRSPNGVVYDWEARAVKEVLDRARRKLGADAWDVAVHEGRLLEADEALASAVEWTAPGPGDAGESLSSIGFTR